MDKGKKEAPSLIEQKPSQKEQRMLAEMLARFRRARPGDVVEAQKGRQHADVRHRPASDHVRV